MNRASNRASASCSFGAVETDVVGAVDDVGSAIALAD